MRSCKNYLKVARTFVTVIASAFIFLSCSKDPDPVPVIPTAFVSLYQGSPDSPGLDIEVDNKQINNSSFDFGTYTGYLRFYTGDRTLRFTPVGADNIAADTIVTFDEGKIYSVFVVDRYANAGILIVNDESAVPSPGKAKLRFLNLSPDVAAADLAVNGQDQPIFDNQLFKAQPEFREVDATTYNFEVRTNTDAAPLDLRTLTLREGGYYTIVVRGFQTPPTGNVNVLSAQLLIN